MARTHTVFIDPETWPASPGMSVEPSAEEHHHLTRVLRAHRGEVVRAVDGAGRSGTYLLQAVSKRSSTLVLQSDEYHPRTSGGLRLAIGWTKSSRQTWLLEKAVELGVREVIFFSATRSQGKPPAEPKPGWLNTLHGALKQSERLYLPRITCLQGGVAELPAQVGEDIALVLCEPRLGEAASPFEPDALTNRTGLAVIGPEGGFTDAELQGLTNAGFAPTQLGDAVLRVETAALTALGLVFHARSRQNG